jgi:hypothetical protein
MAPVVFANKSAGTSLATPIAASVISHFIGYETLILDSSKIKDRLNRNAMSNVISNVPDGTVNKLVNTGINYLIKQGPYIGSHGTDELRKRSPNPIKYDPRFASPGENLLYRRDSNSTNDTATSTITTSYTYSFTSETETATYEGVLPTVGLVNSSIASSSAGTTSTASQSSSSSSAPAR